jgi:protein SCO1/2
LHDYIYGPDDMLANGDPIASALYARYRRVRMPNLSLDSDDVDAVIAYLNQQSATATAAAPSPD